MLCFNFKFLNNKNDILPKITSSVVLVTEPCTSVTLQAIQSLKVELALRIVKENLLVLKSRSILTPFLLVNSLPFGLHVTLAFVYDSMIAS